MLNKMETLEIELLLYSSLINTCPIELVRKVFAYLRKNQNLLNDKDYLTLYNECLDFIKWFSIKHKDITAKDNVDGLFETLADIFNADNPDYAYSSNFVEKYLKFRKDSWSVQ